MVTETVNLSESEWRKGERGEGWGPGDGTTRQL